MFGCRFSPGYKHINTSGRLQGRTSSNIEIATTVGRCELAVTFRDIERYGSRGPIKLVMDSDGFGDSFQKHIGPFHELDGLVIHIQAFMIELLNRSPLHDYEYE